MGAFFIATSVSPSEGSLAVESLLGVELKVEIRGFEVLFSHENGVFEAKTAANVDMAFLTAAQNLVEMRSAPSSVFTHDVHHIYRSTVRCIRYNM